MEWYESYYTWYLLVFLVIIVVLSVLYTCPKTSWYLSLRKPPDYVATLNTGDTIYAQIISLGADHITRIVTEKILVTYP